MNITIWQKSGSLAAIIYDFVSYAFHSLFYKFYSAVAFFVFLILFFVFCAFSAFAAEALLTSPVNQMAVGEVFEAIFSINNSENENINAVEGEIIFPEDLLEVKEIRDGGSIINFWIEDPKIKSGNKIIFSGITPGGFSEKKGLIFSAIFKTKKGGSGEIGFSRIKALLNDGIGTETKIAVSSLNFSISEEIVASRFQEVKDIVSPESFFPQIVQDKNVFDNKWFLVFSAQDKGVGIDHYEILESRSRKIENKKWTEAESPYILSDQNLKSYIYIKAIDNEGNIRIESLSPRNRPAWYENFIILCIITLGVFIIVILFIVWVILRKRMVKV